MVLAGISAYAYGDTQRIKRSTVYFKNGSTVIAAEFEDDLKKIQAALTADSAIGLQIEGYGRNSGPPEKNRAITQKRAEAVQRWFVEHGFDASRLEIKSPDNSKTAIGKDKPRDPALAERVEIWQVYLKLPLAHLPALRYEFAPVMEGEQVVHDFVVQNIGSATLEIQKVRTD
jgi:outer membrane protein OmpA-like peptidoglycan-associated protein